MSERHLTVVGGLLVAIVTCSVSLGQMPSAAGGEVLVNARTSGDQFWSAVGMSGAGSFVVVWVSPGGDGSGHGVFGRRFDSLGVAQTDDFQISSATLGYQTAPSIDMNATGVFVVAWTTYSVPAQQQDVMARRFTAAGAPQGADFLVNVVTLDDQRQPSVAIDGSGGFVIAWQSPDGSDDGIFGRRFSAAGNSIGLEFAANTSTSFKQFEPRVDSDTSGDFVVVWTSLHEPSYGVFGQRFGSNGARQGPEFALHSYITNEQREPRVGLDDDGDFVAVWRSNLQDGSSHGVFGRRFDSAGTPLGIEFQVDSLFTGLQNRAEIAVDADGDFVVAWQSDAFDASSYDIFLKRYKASGLALTPDLRVNNSLVGPQQFPAVAGDVDGDFVVSWTSNHLNGTSDVFLQRFDVAPAFDVDGNGVFEALTDGLLILRFGFGFTGATLISNAVGPGCTRCDAASIGAYLATFL